MASSTAKRHIRCLVPDFQGGNDYVINLGGHEPIQSAPDVQGLWSCVVSL